MGVAFDTLKFVEKLESGGFSHAQAKAAAEAFADATGEQLATKADVRELRGDIAKLEAATKADTRELRGDIAKLEAATKADIRELRGDIAKSEAAAKADIAQLEAATKADIAKLAEATKAAIADSKTEMLKWMFVQTLLLIGVLMALLRFGH